MEAGIWTLVKPLLAVMTCALLKYSSLSSDQVTDQTLVGLVCHWSDTLAIHSLLAKLLYSLLPDLQSRGASSNFTTALFLLTRIRNKVDLTAYGAGCLAL